MHKAVGTNRCRTCRRAGCFRRREMERRCRFRRPFYAPTVFSDLSEVDVFEAVATQNYANRLRYFMGLGFGDSRKNHQIEQRSLVGRLMPERPLPTSGRVNGYPLHSVRARCHRRWSSPHQFHIGIGLAIFMVGFGQRKEDVSFLIDADQGGGSDGVARLLPQALSATSVGSSFFNSAAS